MKKTILVMVLFTTMAFGQIIDINKNVTNTPAIDNTIIAGPNNTQILKQVVILARDPGSTITIPSWFTASFTSPYGKIIQYFKQSTLDKCNYEPIVLTADATHGYEMTTTPIPANHEHGEQNLRNILSQIDVSKNFADYDYDNDGIVDVCFVSLTDYYSANNGYGVSGLSFFPSFETNDNWYIGGVLQGKVKIDVTVEVRSSNDEYTFMRIFVHENGHQFFEFADQEHRGGAYHDHYGLGSFDVMSNKGFNNQRPSPYSPPFAEIKCWVTPVILSNNNDYILQDYQYNKKLYKYEALSYSNSVPNQKYYLSYIVPSQSEVFSGFPTPDPNIGGLLIYHAKGNALSDDQDRFSNWKNKDIDLEYADGKFNWDDYRYKLDANPLSGRDKLDVRKMTNNNVTGGSFWDYRAGNYTTSIGDQSAFYLPADGKSFSFYSNPTSNLMNINENYDENIPSGLSVKNLRYENGQVKAAIKINDYSVSQNTTLPLGKWYFNNTLTVNAGVTLTIQPGTELYFSTNANLIVHGTLNAVGSSANRIKFDKIATSSNWNGISMGNGSSGNIQYCDIKNANYGFSISYVSPLIKYCNISNNGVGISLSYWANPTLVGNTINNNTSHGIACYYYSSPRLNDYYSDYNVIKDNGGCGVSANYNSNPVLSKGYYSNGNSIKNNSSYEVSANSNCTVDATNVWWNVTTPPYYNNNDFYQYQSSISIVPPRETDPNPGRSIQSNPEENNSQSTISLSMQGQDDDLTLAHEKQREKKYDEAISLFLEIFKKNKDELIGRYALVKIEECFTQAGKKDYREYSKKEIKPLLKEGSETYVAALELKLIKW
ncbi:MAG: hypothetical protein FD143_1629 [Ignavibacteria bacterium]|nr:MAG: hypothetical protein FD143_1629 [Ignavibacteria bacterium]KAF0161807.1 MAG: hypothetical protein FD188_612 [Ignavibacteria bacterium]